ncbi:MAG: hypothetical protein A2086_07395 [Spirochaetes bacterium GWD1_27_9]|nr:MAG: hypothetical protein A2Z98_13260 [Spirochaetes bacterium GWB1_27_13]OHD26282.1 MAG: hypothetical protein A2Y34_13205 [Spirochaetes bacterium GWC1_27_15]OHD32118.1 MAG: hypothetical protein A2086_07395 [Spirochaetes bacterium GWD1_27_9]
MNSFSLDIYNKIASQFFYELEIKNQIYREQDEVKLINITKDNKKVIFEIESYFKDLSLYSSFESYDSITMIIIKLSYFEMVFNNNIISNKEIVTDEIMLIFLKMLGFQCIANSYSLENIININFYLDYIEKIIKLVNQNKYSLEKDQKEILQFVKRCYYLSFHEVNFKPQEKILNLYHNLIVEDLEFLKETKSYEYYNVLYSYLYILIDHKFFTINELEDYVDDDIFNNVLSDVKKNIGLVKNDKLQFKYYSLFFKFDIYNLKLKLKKHKEIDEITKKNLIVKCAKLIELFYKDKHNVELFFDSNHPIFSVDYKESLTLFSKQIVKILNDSENNVNDVLFILFLFLSNFTEYLKLNINIYNRINFILKKNFNRRISVISTILYFKTITDAEQLKTEIAKLKRSIEKSPISSLIYLYNAEIGYFPLLSDQLKFILKINSIIIEINEKIYYVHKMILQNISKFKNDYRSSPDYNIKLEYLLIFYNEMKNVFKVVSDPYLVTDVGKLYGYFIDNYIESKSMDYRQDFVDKSRLVKMSIFDINPMTFAISLLFSKLGKLSLFLNHQDPKRLSIKKKFLTTAEKEQFAPFVDLSIDFLPKEESGYDWLKVENIIKEIRNKALSSKNMTPPEARIIKVLCAFFNKVTRNEEKTTSVFNNLYDESFVKLYNYWDLDPIFIYYLNIYFSKRGKQEFVEEYTGEKFDITFGRINNSVILDQIYNYVEDLLEYTDLNNNEIFGMLDDVSKADQEFLIDQNLQRKRKSVIELSRDIKQNRLLIYELNNFDLIDKMYLSDILKNILIICGKSSIINPLIFILNELIEFFQQANIKRIYFEKRNLDIELKYSIGIISFNEMIKENYHQYKELMKEIKSKIRVTFQIYNEEFIIAISNNYRLHKEEIKQINDQIQAGRKASNLKDVYKSLEFSKNKNNYGLIMILLFLKKFGIEKSLKLNILDEESKFIITIPLNIISENDQQKLAEEIVKEIDRIPKIPEHISELKKKLDDPESSIDEIERLILKDPSLTGDILKTANSSYYAISKEISSIHEAITFIGVKAISNILIFASSYKLLNNKIAKDKMEGIIKHSEQTAFFAKELLKYKKIQTNADDIYLGALLHDFGKIVVEGLNPGVYEKIQDTLENSSLSIEDIEDIAGGLSHAMVGGLISVKWNFPDIVTEIIRCHHSPRSVNKYPDAVFIVYLANVLTHFLDNKIVYENIDQNVLEFLEIESSEKLNKIANDIDILFKKHKKI